MAQQLKLTDTDITNESTEKSFSETYCVDQMESREGRREGGREKHQEGKEQERKNEREERETKTNRRRIGTQRAGKAITAPVPREKRKPNLLNSFKK